ncbi:MAG: hypothetical protein HZA51_04620 [Planctomycetes bacterium]|nr:hypothetical protein [Planctomycetota bacterium]
MKRWVARSQIAVVGIACLMAGCQFVVPGCDYSFVDACVVDPTLVVVDDAASPAVPDQEITGCSTVSINRTYANETERAMIQTSEDLASTVGSTWYSDPLQAPYFDGERLSQYPGAVTSEALFYYAQRVLSVQTSTTPENPRVNLTYTARLLGEPRGALYYYNGALIRPTVRHELQYGEGFSQVIGANFTAWREVEFDQAGVVAQIRGDGEISMTVARVVNSD